MGPMYIETPYKKKCKILIKTTNAIIGMFGSKEDI